MERYNIALYVTGQIEVHELGDEMEEISEIISQIIANTDIFWTNVDVDFVTKAVNKEELKAS